MEPIRRGDRGASVEDVQRRLLSLGFDLGPTGVDGVFEGATLAAVSSFQKDRALFEDGEVGPETWAALVDATFILGDRLLYLRLPYFHGEDVRVLQSALNGLGFAVGCADGIFGPFCEHAVREFQANAGLPVDGIAGPDTFRAITNLRHTWADRAPDAPDALHRCAARSSDTLKNTGIALLALDEAGASVAGRLRNLAVASEPDARVEIVRNVGGSECLTLILGIAGDDRHFRRV